MTSYWLAAYAWDLINSLIPIIVTIIIFACFNVEAYSGVALGAVFLVLVSSLPTLQSERVMYCRCRF